MARRIEYNLGDKVIMLEESWGCLEGKVYEIREKKRYTNGLYCYRLLNEQGGLMWIKQGCFTRASDCHKCQFDCKGREKCFMFEEVKIPIKKRFSDRIRGLIGR